MNQILRSAVIVGFTLLTVFLCHKFPNAATDPKTGLRLALPSEIEGHLSYDKEVSAAEKEWLPSDTGMLKRQYFPRNATSKEDAMNRSIAATLILSGSDQRSLHRPEVCLDGQNWTIKKHTIKKLEVNGKQLKVKDLHLEMMQMQADDTLKKIQAHYVYWWVGSNTSTPDTMQRALISAKENMLYNRNTRWGYPSIMTYVDLDKGEEREAAQKRAYGFIEQYGSTFLKNY